MDFLDKIRADEPMIGGIDHVAIIVKDMDRSIKFYSGVLGLTVLHDGRNDGGNRKSFLGRKDKSFVALTENPGKNMDSSVVESVCHIAFKVEKLEKAKDILATKGIEFIEEKKNEKGKIVAYHFHDPDGFELEIYGEEEEIVPAY